MPEPSPLSQGKCPGCGAAASELGACAYCGTPVASYEKAADGLGDVRITAPGQRVIVSYLKTQDARVRAHMGSGCLVVLAGGGGGGLLASYVGAQLGHPIVPALTVLVIGVVTGIVVGMREDRLLCENELVPDLRKRMAEEGVGRAEAQRLASETLKPDSTLLQSILSKL